MNDLGCILTLWRELETSNADYVLATVVDVEGSSYRKPGARMLLSADGRRAGTVSGGCLEAEVTRRAWWLTVSGPVVEPYSTVDDEDERPYGAGCGGIVHLLLERRATALPLLVALDHAYRMRTPLGVVTLLEGPRIGQHVCADASPEVGDDPLHAFAAQALQRAANCAGKVDLNGFNARVWAEFVPARVGLWLFGAGDDARPLAAIAHQLGWHIALADGRSHLASRQRFPLADDVSVLAMSAMPAQNFSVRPTDAAVVMTHSFEQDARILATLFSGPILPAYIGVLGPQRRTRELLTEATRLLGLPSSDQLVDRWLAVLYAPTGLDLGANSPAAIALSVAAEIQQVLSGSSAQSLRRVRAIL